MNMVDEHGEIIDEPDGGAWQMRRLLEKREDLSIDAPQSLGR